MPAENIDIVRRGMQAAIRRPEPDYATLNELYDPDHELVSRMSELEGGGHRGARGFGSSTASPPDANVAFPVGAYYYLVGFGSSAPTRSQLITAAQRLYRRVRG